MAGGCQPLLGVEPSARRRPPRRGCGQAGVGLPVGSQQETEAGAPGGGWAGPGARGGKEGAVASLGSVLLEPRTVSRGLHNRHSGTHSSGGPASETSLRSGNQGVSRACSSGGSRGASVPPFSRLGGLHSGSWPFPHPQSTPCSLCLGSVSLSPVTLSSLTPTLCRPSCRDPVMARALLMIRVPPPSPEPERNRTC